MLETIRNPNTFYATGDVIPPISQNGLTKDVYNYYWTSYSRGTDGGGIWFESGDPLLGNVYLDGYNQQRPKSLFDPCPYGFRVPINGTYNKFSNSCENWKRFNYNSGIGFLIDNQNTWLALTGSRHFDGYLSNVGEVKILSSSTASNNGGNYSLLVYSNTLFNSNKDQELAKGSFIRCIEG